MDDIVDANDGARDQGDDVDRQDPFWNEHQEQCLHLQMIWATMNIPARMHHPIAIDMILLLC